MAGRYRLSPEAKDDLVEIRAFYLEKADATIARYVLGEITRGFRFVASRPGAGHRRKDLTDEPVRFWPVFSYLIVYDPAIRPLSIVRILHANRDVENILRQSGPR